MQYMAATLILRDRHEDRSGMVVERVVWLLDKPLSGSSHRFKYRLWCGRGGRTLVRYDNEKGKGDHRHEGPDERENSYEFTTLEKLFEDFDADVRRVGGR
jgi:hypothetical protein